MQTISNSQAPKRQPLAFHLRRLRQWHGEKGILQSELAYLSGVSLRFLRGYEGSRKLARNVEALVALSLALEVPVEDLIAPHLTDELKQAVAKRREILGSLKGASQPVSQQP